MTLFYRDDQITLYAGDALAVTRELGDGAADCIVTSPPYFGLRDYGINGQYGLEKSPAAYVETMRALFSELRRVLADDGTLWLNIGDSYASGAGGKPGQTTQFGGPRVREQQAGSLGVGDRPHKNLLGIPWRVAFALQDDGWILRNAIIWNKPNAMPESVTDRLSGRYEHVFLFSKSPRYWFDLDPIREPALTAGRNGSRGSYVRVTNGLQPAQTTRPTNAKRTAGLPIPDAGRNPGDVWTIPTAPFAAAHFAVMPPALAQRCIQAGCKPAGTVLDPFNGAGTTGHAAQATGRKYIGIDINPEYLYLTLKTRLHQAALNFETPA